MGAISDALNPPKDFSVGGETITVRRISFSELYAIMRESLHELGEQSVGVAVEKKIEDCLTEGEIPKCAFRRILKGGLSAMEGVDDADLDALMGLSRLQDVMDAVVWITGLSDDSAAGEGAERGETGPGGAEKKTG